MSYTKKLTTFTKGNQLSNCGEYNLQDLQDMFSETEIGGAEDENGDEVVLEDILTESESSTNDFDLFMSVTIMEELDDDEVNMFIVKSEDEDTNNEVECSLELDYEFANESI